MRAPSLLAASGAALAAISIGGLFWMALAGRDQESVIRLGESGLTATALAWAAAAAGWRRTIGRAALAGAALAALVVGTVTLWVSRVIGLELVTDRSTEFDPIQGIVRHTYVAPHNWGLLLIAWFAAFLAVAPLARVARTSRLPIRRALAFAVCLVPFAGNAMIWLSRGAEAAAAMTILSAAWLAWALIHRNPPDPTAEFVPIA